MYFIKHTIVVCILIYIQCMNTFSKSCMALKLQRTYTMACTTEYNRQAPVNIYGCMIALYRNNICMFTYMHICLSGICINICTNNVYTYMHIYEHHIIYGIYTYMTYYKTLIISYNL